MRYSRLLSAAAIIASPAGAQTMEPSVAPQAALGEADEQASLATGDQSTESTAPKLDEIIVTARSRQESISRVPISITAVTGTALANRSISTLSELQLSLPNFQVTKTGLSTQTYVRGIGSGNDPAFEQSVAQFRDGVAYARGQLTRTPFFDLERVEVLRGPQSILFGKNAVAGAVSVITAQPANTFEGGLTATYTPEFHAIETTGFLNTPLSDTLSNRVAVRYLSDNGYVYNTVKGRNEPRRREFAIRDTLRFERPGFSASLKGEYSKINESGRELQVIRDIATILVPSGPQAGQPLTYVNALALRGLGGVLVDTSMNYRRQTELPEYDNTQVYSGILTTETDIGESTLTTITGYLDYTRNFLVDLDFTAANLQAVLATEGYQQFSQEVRIATPAADRFAIIAGLYYEHNVIDYDQISAFGPQLTAFNLASAANKGVVRYFKQSNDNYAAFAQATVKITPAFRFVGGLRLTRDEKVGSRSLVARMGQFDYNGAVITDIAILNTFRNSFGYSLNNPGSPGHDLRAKQSETHLVPSVTLEYDVTPAILLFASWKKGFKAGGFDARGNSNASFGFKAEGVEAIEGGVRIAFPNQRASLSLTGYRNIFTNLQTSQFDGRVGFNTQNAGKVRTQGFEIEGRYAIATGVSISSALSYLDFRYLDFRRGNCYFGQVPNGDVVNGVALCDYTGLRGRFTPKWNLSGGVNIDRSLGGETRFKGGIEAAYKSRHNVHDNLDPLGVVAGYTIVNARAGLSFGPWSLAVLAKNLLDEKVLTFAANVPFSSGATIRANTQYGSALPGRSVSIQASVQF